MTIENIDPKLFTSIKVGPYLLNSRITMCPLSRLRATNDHLPSQLNLEYYDERSKIPGSFLVTESTAITDKFGAISHMPGIWNAQQTQGWSKIVEKVHENKSYIFLQLGAHLKTQPLCYMSLKKWNPPNVVEEYEELFANAVLNAISGAKFDGVEIAPYQYCAFLLKRNVDEGDRLKLISRFCHFLKDKIAPVVGLENMNRVGLKISILSQEEQIFLVKKLNEVGLSHLAYLSITELRLTNLHVDSDASLGSNDWIREEWNGTVIRMGGYLDNIAKLNIDILANDKTLIGVGRYYSSNPNLINQLKNGDPLKDYNRLTFYTNTSVGYLHWLEEESSENHFKHQGPVSILEKS
ncbi:NADPH dehydrogenase 2 [[Candida] railenensis]|uniref:NADPH dehydrogenase 2 n=1 Tax=[Candida] railenensis TaxID=45579 RepID=A0A9P0QVT5_9ASCO|nr:NADPH dehydrogenase 2 [[Candida] railenensis]